MMRTREAVVGWVVVITILVLIFAGVGYLNHKISERDNQRLLECIEQTDDTEWCVEQFGH